MNPINELKKGLLKLNNPNYDNIDKLMRKIMKKYDMTAKELHYDFRASHKNKTPDEWIKETRKMKTFKEFLNTACSNFIEEGRGSTGQSVEASEKLASYIGKRAARNPQNVDKYWEGILKLKGRSPSGANILKSAKYSRAKEMNRLTKEDYELYDVISEYLIDGGYAENYNEVDFIIENVEDEIFYEIISEMRKEDKVKGRKKQPRMVEVTRKVPGKIVKGEDGEWKITKPSVHKEKKVSTDVHIGMYKSGRIGAGPTFGYRPHLHGPGGLHRGKKKKDQTRIPEPRYNTHQRWNELNRKKSERVGKMATHGMIGDRAAERRAEAGKKNFGVASREWSNNFNRKPKKKSTSERMAAAADKLGLKD